MEVNRRKDKYIDRAIAVLKQDGLRLSLDEIAAKMGVAKKTLYNHFSSKDELIKESIRAISLDFREALSGLDDPDRPSIESLRESFARVGELFMVVSPVFFSDLMRGNPSQAMLEHLVGSDFFQRKILSNLRQGIAEGVFREDLDVEFVSTYMSYSIFGFYINGIVHGNAPVTSSYFEEVLEYHLRAITTAKGRQVVDSSHE